MHALALPLVQAMEPFVVVLVTALVMMVVVLGIMLELQVVFLGIMGLSNCHLILDPGFISPRYFVFDHPV